MKYQKATRASLVVVGDKKEMKRTKIHCPLLSHDKPCPDCLFVSLFCFQLVSLVIPCQLPDHKQTATVSAWNEIFLGSLMKAEKQLPVRYHT
jgi:hypothetical protein